MTERMVKVFVEDGMRVLCTEPSSDIQMHPGDRCVIEQNRVQELGTVEGFVKSIHGWHGLTPWRIVRRATLQDISRGEENVIMNRLAAQLVKKTAAKHQLDMRIIRVRYTFDRKTLQVLFTVESRMDCLPLVQEVGSELRTSVVMQPVGVRDEAAIIGGIAPCGRVLCCRSWLRKFDAVNIRMAKTQRISANPAVINGMCCRLKCCLRFEQHVYENLEREFPANGTHVETPAGPGVVVDGNLLAGVLRIKLADGGMRSFGRDEVKWKGPASSSTEPLSGENASEESFELEGEWQ